MMSILTSTYNRGNDDTEGFGFRWDSPDDYLQHTAATMLGIPSNTSTCACFKPLLGLFSQSKYIPLTWCPLTLEFEIVSNATDAIVTPFPGGEFDGSTSISWQIEDVRLIADIVTLDNGLQNSYAEHVLSGR